MAMAMALAPPPPIALLFLISSLVTTTLLLPASASAAASAAEEEHRFITTTSAKKSSTMTPKISHLHFYFHDVVSGSNPTAVPVAKPLVPPSPPSFFGLVTMMDDPLTEGPEPESKRIGYAQGMYSSASQTEVAFLMTMNLYFTEGEYNGSALSVLGRNPPMQSVREMPVVGGSGLFRFARGYALAHTHWIDFKSGDAIVEYNVTVMHY